MTLTKRHTKWYGWHRQLPDQRDIPARTLGGVRKGVLPKTVRLDKRAAQPAVYDQGPLGSCTANGIAGCAEYTLRELKLITFTPSRLAIYWGERFIENSVGFDAGAYIRDGLKVVAKEGVAPERLWPYDAQQYRTKPPAAYYTEAAKHTVTQYGFVDQTADALQRMLASGDPVVFGFTVYDSFESGAVATSGVVPMPAPTETVLGGHCVVIMGYIRWRGVWYFICRNSWGTAWGRAGFFLMPFDYVLDPDLSDDFWRITTVQGEKPATKLFTATKNAVRVARVTGVRTKAA